ncbi:DinB family protein [Limnochorda pilosa]|uniref:DinB family protein n=1 Tax=Limnochorda pilosa TaxID=1555112 RepID=A0A0K2SNQ7_LIMPI|nr:DinB family protein [Limnochorda pilosa]BAS28731.1 DinB family protein [Limnochorda pilosa]
MDAFPEIVFKALSERPFQLLDLARKLPEGGFTWQPYPSVKSIRAILVHMLGAEEFWVEYVLRGQPRTERDPAAFPSPATLEEVWRPVRERTVAYLRGLGEEELARRHPLPWNQAERLTGQEIAWHVVTHEFHHKGQVCTRLAMLGVEVPDLDIF